MSGEAFQDPRVTAASAALAPYAWRALTAEMVARRVLGAVDRLLVLDVIGTAASDNDSGPVSAESVDRNDPRLEPMLEAMGGFRWRDVTPVRLSQVLVSSLDRWWLERDALEAALERMLGEAR